MKSSKTSFLRNCISGWNVRDSSEEFFLAHVDIFYFPRGDFEISTWGQLALISNF